MPDPRHLMDPRCMEVVAVLRHALQLLDALELRPEAALVSHAIEIMAADVTSVANAGAE